MKHTIAECILVMQTLLISCHAWNGIIIDTRVSYGATQLIQPNQVPHVVNVSFGLPHHQSGEAVALPDGRVYFFGGVLIGNGIKNTVTRFDPTTNTSTAATPMNTARQEFGATVVGDQIVVCGCKCL